jgi:hypothetical protein
MENEKPNYDARVKSVIQIENIYLMLKRITIFVGLSLLAGLLLAGISKAQSIPDMYMVPVVRLTPSGAAVVQPQTGAGYNYLPGYNSGTGPVSSANSGLNTLTESGAPSNIDGGSNYIAPQYDAFAEGSTNQPVTLPVPTIRNIDTVDFSIRNNLAGSIDQSYGTTKTIFNFTANVISKDLRAGQMEYRWDFDNDGVPDSYFSVIRSITHSYALPGEYEVRMQVLDSYGNISEVTKKVYVAANDAPAAYFKVDRVAGPVNSIIRFDTSYSSDNQYTSGNLLYRFDWDGDGKFDTNYQNKSTWNHLFREPGSYNVIMETRDPEGATARAEITITISDDSPPTARLSVEKASGLRITLDASQSSDDYTPLSRLKFRWDFNYTGPDDIVFDSGWSGSSRINGTYRIGGSKMIRLQVQDEQGFIDETFAQIEVPWPEEYLSLFANMI